MRRFIALLGAALALIACCSCDSNTEDITSPTVTTPATEERATESEATTDKEENTMEIKLSVNGSEAVVRLYDNDAAQDLVSMLPITVTFEDYNSVEKIAYLPRELSLGSAPTSCDPVVGTFAYYAPWGNLSVFYNDFRHSNSLIPLGEFVSGIELFRDMSGDFSVTISK